MNPESETGQARDKLMTAAAAVFWAQVVILLAIAAVMDPFDIWPTSNRWFEYVFFPGIALLFVLGIVLIVLTVKARVKGALKLFLVLTGAAAIGFPLSAVLHNLIYALFILMFGEGFWDRFNGGDEGFFFILAIFVCPLVFLVGAVGSIVMLIRGKLRPAD